eukprot:4091150-Prymnesium_polylepis.1
MPSASPRNGKRAATILAGPSSVSALPPRPVGRRAELRLPCTVQLKPGTSFGPVGREEYGFTPESQLTLHVGQITPGTRLTGDTRATKSARRVEGTTSEQWKIDNLSSGGRMHAKIAN